MAKKTAEPDPTDRIGARKTLEIHVTDPEQARRDIARLLVSPEFAAARAVRAVEGESHFGAKLDTPELLECLRAQARQVNGGDLSDLEGMLMNQATTLQTLFARLMERGMVQTALPCFETHLRLALRAQAQCRATVETLATIKNPPVVFARQANIANGPQQVNNVAPSRPQEIETSPTQLLQAMPDEQMDGGTQGATSGAHSQLATVGAVNRPQD